VPFTHARRIGATENSQPVHQVFNLIILWVLYTGMQWKCLPVPHDPQGKPVIHYTTVYKVFLRRNN